MKLLTSSSCQTRVEKVPTSAKKTALLRERSQVDTSEYGRWIALLPSRRYFLAFVLRKKNELVSEGATRCFPQKFES